WISAWRAKSSLHSETMTSCVSPFTVSLIFIVVSVCEVKGEPVQGGPGESRTHTPPSKCGRSTVELSGPVVLKQFRFLAKAVFILLFEQLACAGIEGIVEVHHEHLKVFELAVRRLLDNLPIFVPQVVDLVAG